MEGEHRLTIHVSSHAHAMHASSYHQPDARGRALIGRFGSKPPVTGEKGLGQCIHKFTSAQTPTARTHPALHVVSAEAEDVHIQCPPV